MTDLLLVLCFVGFMALGTLAPFVLSLGYVWVDTFSPHSLSYGLLTSLPVSFLIGATAFASYLLFDRRNPPRPTLLLGLYFVLAVWITLTTTWAILPVQAFSKYDTAIKTLLFAAFMPFVFRTRVQIEAFVQVMLFSAAAHILPWGLKTAVAGGGYERSLGLLGNNAIWLSESSAISAICFTYIPILMYLARHNVLLPPSRYTKAMFYGLCCLFAIGAIGTYARTALVGLAVMSAGLWWRAKHKIGFAIGGVAAFFFLLLFTSDRWMERVGSVENYQAESSGGTRVLVWRWTWNFALQNPLGGGFNSFMVNRIESVSSNPSEPPVVQFGRAFHNIYFAALGEHGFPGLAVYLSILILTFVGLHAIRKRLRAHPEHAWCYNLAGALQISLATMLACANFVDMSFSPLIWNFLALGLCLICYAHRTVPVVKTSRWPVGSLTSGSSPAPSRA